mmetsp:Transcript_49167/g.131611  ORF Transcript_49167/g.131611 Transcript_49167/m.131611 type:complete len:314 (+) Transcript_49167:97-1038(+)
MTWRCISVGAMLLFAQLRQGATQFVGFIPPTTTATSTTTMCLGLCSYYSTDMQCGTLYDSCKTCSACAHLPAPTPAPAPTPSPPVPTPAPDGTCPGLCLTWDYSLRCGAMSASCEGCCSAGGVPVLTPAPQPVVTPAPTPAPPPGCAYYCSSYSTSMQCSGSMTAFCGSCDVCTATSMTTTTATTATTSTATATTTTATTATLTTSTATTTRWPPTMTMSVTTSTVTTTTTLPCLDFCAFYSEALMCSASMDSTCGGCSACTGGTTPPPLPAATTVAVPQVTTTKGCLSWCTSYSTSVRCTSLGSICGGCAGC